jgi:serine/threonine protein kinase/CheY-like chemotaxis protein
MLAKPTLTADGATLLVVDDNEMNRDMLGRRLERKGYRVLSAESGARALEVVAREKVDLVLLDIEMPGLSGMDVLRRLRQTHGAAELPIIMATARSDSQDMVQALEAGANDYVVKPLDFPVVLARVEAQLRTRRAAARRREPAVLSDAEAQPGHVLAGKYRLEALIGSGAFGSVYRARHVELEHDVAVKVLQTAAGRSPEALARFKREGIAACRVKHPNAVTVTDFGVTDGGAAFLVMELLEGHGLEEEIQRSGCMSPRRCAEVLSPLCGALAEAHAAGIVHRDVKPANVFLHRTARGEVVKVLDFGIAKMLDEDARAGNLTVDGGLIGTPAFMAPERFRGGTPTGATDVYSVGVMLYQMLSGELPFSAPESDLMAIAMMQLNRDVPPLRELVPELSPAVEQVVLSALQKEPDGRPSAAALAASFARAVGLEVGEPAVDLEITVVEEPPAPKPRPTPRRRVAPPTLEAEVELDDLAPPDAPTVVTGPSTATGMPAEPATRPAAGRPRTVESAGPSTSRRRRP